MEFHLDGRSFAFNYAIIMGWFGEAKHMGSLLFVFYVDDLLDQIKHVFSDGSQLIYSDWSFLQAEFGCCLLRSFCAVWDCEGNVLEECFVMSFETTALC